MEPTRARRWSQRGPRDTRNGQGPAKPKRERSEDTQLATKTSEERIAKLEEDVARLTETLMRVASELNGDRGACKGDAAVVRDCIIHAIEDRGKWN